MRHSEINVTDVRKNGMEGQRPDKSGSIKILKYSLPILNIFIAFIK